MKKIFLLAVLSLTVLFVFAGCGGTPSADEVAANVCSELATTLGMDEQDIQSGVETVNDNMSESHQMMALMILSGAEMDTDLDSYDKVYLVDVANSDGSIDGAVVVVIKDGTTTTVIPQGLKDQIN